LIDSDESEEEVPKGRKDLDEEDEADLEVEDDEPNSWSGTFPYVLSSPPCLFLMIISRE